MQNPQGTVSNTHRYLDAPEEGRYVREHVVDNPRGEMTQTWERLNTEEGYQYRRLQTWTDPEGTPLRQHERTLSGADPYNYTREHSVTLRDGRTISQTQVRSWDGETGTTARWWNKLNPLARDAADAGQPASASASRRGFTIGTPGADSGRPSSFASGEQRSALARQNSHRPWWAGSSSRSTRSQGPPPHANGISSASRPNPGNGKNH